MVECSITRRGLRRDGLCEAEKEAARLKKEPRQIEATITGDHEGTKPLSRKHRTTTPSFTSQSNKDQSN